jgi:hypothetical protein
MPDLLKTLDQEEWWYGQDGYPYKIAGMEQSHRVNVQAFLRRRAKNIYDRHQRREFRIMESAPDDVFNEWMTETERGINSDPVEWLDNTPFMRALGKAIKNANTIDGEVVTDEVAVRPNAEFVVVDKRTTRHPSPTGRMVEDLPLRFHSVHPRHERFSD